MIISGKRRKIDGSVFPLERWLLAPLGLNENVEYCACYEAKATKPDQTEILVTTIPEELWPDVWRIEIETLDKAGNLYLLTDLLEHHNIDIIVSEGSINAFGKKHSMSFIIACHKYRSFRDSEVSRRVLDAYPTLPDLEFEICLNFADQLSFVKPNQPRVKIKRIDEYWRLHREKLEKSRIPLPLARLRDHSLQIDEARVRRLLTNKSAAIWYSPAIDTKNRLLRLLCFADDANAPFHIQVAYADHHTKAVRRLFQLLFELDLNVIRYQVRIGGNQETKELLPDVSDGRVSRMDVTFERYVHDGAQYLSMPKIREAIGSDNELRSYGVVVCKSHSEPGLENG